MAEQLHHAFSYSNAEPDNLNKKDGQLSPFLSTILERIKPLEESFRDQAQKKVDLKTKPLGALGRIEKLAVQLSTIKKNLNPKVESKRLFVFAGDHGVVETGLNLHAYFSDYHWMSITKDQYIKTSYLIVSFRDGIY